LKQSNAELQRQLNEHAEHVAKFPRLQAELRWMDAELADARRMRMAADAAAAMQAESSRCDLETVQRRLVVESTVRREAQVAAADAHERSENTRRQLEAETKVNQQLQSEQAQWDQEMTRVRQSVAQFTREKRQLDQEKAQLQQQLNKHAEKLASSQEQNAAAGSSQSDRLITVKQEKIDAVADAHGAAQQAAKAAAGKRKAESELESEAKRRRSVEGELASLTEQMDEQDKCIVCFDKQPDALFLRCKHLVCCSECAETIMRGAAAGAACPTCRKPLRARDVIKVFRA
jgi:chromosome segregation ATPase